MRLGVRTSSEDLKKTQPWTYAPRGYEYGEDEEKVIFHLRPWTRTAQGAVEKRTKMIGMEADDLLKKVGTGDKKAEAYLRALADYLIADWEGVVFAEDCRLEIEGELREFKAGEPMPCTTTFKVFLFEDVQVAVDVVEAARNMATVQFSDERKNAVRSSGGTDAVENSLSLTSA